MNVPNPRVALRIGRVELRRSRRRLLGRASKLLQVAVVGIFVGLYSIGGAAGAFFAGRWIAAGDGPAAAPAFVGAGLLALALFVAFFVITHALKTDAIDGLPGLLTTVPYEDVVAGVVVATFGRVLAFLGVPVVLVAAAFATGAGAPLAGVTLAVVVLAAVALGVLLGLAVAFLVRFVAGNSRFLTRHRSAIAFALSLLVPAAWIVGSTMPTATRPIGTVLLASPARWAGHLLFAPVPGAGTDPLLVAAAAVAVPAVLASVAGVAIVLAGQVWYGDPVQLEHAHHASGGRFARFEGLPLTMRAVANKSLKRARRAPFTVQFAVFPFFFLVWRIQSILLQGQVPPGLAVELAIASAITAGAAFSLNPLGGEEGVLPLTLTARITGWEFVGGLALAGATIGVPLVVGLPVLAGLGAGLDAVSLLAAVLVGLVLTAAAPGIAAGFGVLFPKFEHSTIGTGREVVVPSTWAFVGYTSILLAAAVPAWLAAVPGGRGWLGALVGLGDVSVLVLGLVVTTAVAGGVAVVGYAYAADRVGAYQLD